MVHFILLNALAVYEGAGYGSSTETRDHERRTYAAYKNHRSEG